MIRLCHLTGALMNLTMFSLAGTSWGCGGTDSGQGGDDSDGSSSDSADSATDLAKPSVGPVDARPVYASTTIGPEGPPGCSDPIAVVAHDAGAYAEASAALDCGSLCAPTELAWESESALVASVLCNDLCDRSLTLTTASVDGGGVLALAYTLTSVSGEGCYDSWSRVYAIHAVPRASYSAADATLSRVGP